jgi:hypothetical protein
MPPRPSHIPHVRERTALQKMSATQGLPLEKLEASKQTIAGMVAKGWVKKQSDMRYCITPAGLAALRSKIPGK